MFINNIRLVCVQIHFNVLCSQGLMIKCNKLIYHVYIYILNILVMSFYKVIQNVYTQCEIA